MPDTGQGAQGLISDKDDHGRPAGDRALPRKKRAASPDTHLAASLRAAYEETVREDVPDDFLDLLGKLS